ncbi:MAG TPA: ATP--guanido phosphotransferase [Elusimicrobia bacterium]|nr:ATP--guanido phosphotransferase [Elusimicrobiota bacterium]
MQLGNMLRFKMGWAEPSGRHHEVVLSSRVRLARNLAAHPFPPRAEAKEAASVLAEILEAARGTKALAKAAVIRLDDVDATDRLFLVERHLISPLLAKTPKGRAVLVGERDALSVMVNEEDHLRLQGLSSGLCLEEAFAKAGALDDELSRSLDFAFRSDWGYLAACPTNAGTGLRASCLVHLPGLGLTGEINRVLEGLSRLGMVVRGLYGEGTKVMGDLYQISNAAALGPSEGALIGSITKVVGTLVAREGEARRSLGAGGHRSRLEDLVYRSLGLLQNARVLSYEETMQHLSYVRLALSLGWRMPAGLDTVNELTVLTRPGHVQMLAGKELEAGDRDFLRASLLRKKFA